MALQVRELTGSHRDAATFMVTARRLAQESAPCSPFNDHPPQEVIRGYMRADRTNRHVLVAYEPPYRPPAVEGLIIARSSRDGVCRILWALAPADPARWQQVAAVLQTHMTARWPIIHGVVGDPALQARFAQLPAVYADNADVQWHQSKGGAGSLS